MATQRRPKPPAKETLDTTDHEQLDILRARPNRPLKLDQLAVNAAALGRLCEAVEAADRLMGDRVDRSSNSSVTIPAARVPVSNFSHLDNRSNLWYQRLWLELHRVLGLNVPLGDWDDAG